MSRSPIAPDGASDEYRAGWAAVNKLLRRGHSWSGHERNVAYLNTADGRFADVSSVAGVDFPDDGRGVARVDWDDDGDLDLFLASRTGPRLRYLRNDLADPSGSISLDLVGTTCNRDAIGARVELWLAGDTTPRLGSVRAGEGFLTQSSRRVHFGVPAGARVERLVARWPGGEPETFVPPASDGPDRPAARHWIWTQGAGAEPRPERRIRPLSPSIALPPPAHGRARIVLPAALPLPTLPWIDEQQMPHELFGIEPGGARGTGHPVLVVLWASWCAPCLGELRELTERADELRRAGLTVLALSLDEEADRPAAALHLDRLRWPHGRGLAPRETIDTLDVLQGILLDTEERLAVPTSFLVDARGQLVALYRGPAEVDDLLADLALLDASPEARRAAAVPFEGLWHAPPWEIDLGFIEGRLLKRGYDQVAREYHLGGLEFVQTERAELRWRFGRSLGERGRWAEAAEHYRAALRADPYFVDAWRDLGVVLHQLRDWDASAAAYGEALRLSPDDAGTIYNLGLAHLQRRDAAAVRLQALRLRELGDERADALDGWARKLD